MTHKGFHAEAKDKPSHMPRNITFYRFFRFLSFDSKIRGVFIL